MPTSDWELVQAYTRNRDADSFRELMVRHMGFVYASARRQTSDEQSAADVTQAVFLLLWQRAGTLKPGTIITGWLFNTTRYVAANARRTESRRKIHEREAAAMRIETTQHDQPVDISEFLDGALGSLSERDRQAVLLRYFEDQSLATVGISLGISEDAAKKRVTRAVERLRQFFAARGTMVGSAAIPGLLAMHATAAAPSALMQSTMVLILSGARSGSAISLAKGATKMMSRNQLRLVAAKFLIATACVTAAAATVVTEEHRPSAPVVAVATATAQPDVATATATEDPEYQACRGVLLSILDAYERDDANSLESIYYFDPHTPPQTPADCKLIIELDLADYHLQKIAIGHFGGAASGLFLRVTTLQELIVDILSRSGPEDVTVLDNSVILTPSDNSEGIWPKKPIYFQQVGNGWKLDMGKTFKIVHKVVRQTPVAGETEDQAFAELVHQHVAKLNEISADIESGKIHDVIEAQTAVDQGIAAIDAEYKTTGLTQRYGLNALAAR